MLQSTEQSSRKLPYEAVNTVKNATNNTLNYHENGSTDSCSVAYQGSWLAETSKIISQRQGDRATLTVLFILKHTKIPNTLQKILH